MAATKTPRKAAAKAKPAAAAAVKEPVLPFADQAAWAHWLAKNHAEGRGLWVKIFKKGASEASISYAQALEEALIWGYIDSQKKTFDETAWIQRFTPRGPRSLWSKINCDKVLALIAAGRMQPSGQAEVDRAKQDGRWAQAYDPPSRATVPEDLAAALAQNPIAAAFFATLNATNRYAVLFRVQTAKKPETRARRIALLVEMLARNEKLYP
jgi:uncharacterized protein YdeI (YjbR/CyaY-like superfamily)